MFTSKLIATREVQVVSIPAETGIATTDVLIERIWDDQLHYLLETSKKGFAIGGSFHIRMSLMPLAKVQVHRLAVNLEGQELLTFSWSIH
jgi:arrestin-related trafficking adapter 3/6